jgi:hypothetical protein
LVTLSGGSLLSWYLPWASRTGVPDTTSQATWVAGLGLVYGTLETFSSDCFQPLAATVEVLVFIIFPVLGGEAPMSSLRKGIKQPTTETKMSALPPCEMGGISANVVSKAPMNLAALWQWDLAKRSPTCC